MTKSENETAMRMVDALLSLREEALAKDDLALVDSIDDEICADPVRITAMPAFRQTR